jgi:hypothetical protein
MCSEEIRLKSKVFGPDIINSVVHLIFKEMNDESLRHLAVVASIPHTFDFELLTEIKPSPISIATYEKLTSISFIQPSDQGWRIDPFVRHLFRNYFKHNHRKKFEEYTRACVVYYRKKVMEETDRS